MLADFHVGRVAGRLGAAVYGVVLGSRNDTIVFWIVALHAGNKRHAHARRQKWIFAISFLTASPSRIAKDVDVRRPEVQTFEDVAMPIAHASNVTGAPFSADHDRHAVDRIGIKCRGQADRLGKLGGSVPGHAMQGFAPPVVVRHIQTRHRTRLVHQLCDFFFDRHAVNQVLGPLLWRQSWIHIGSSLGALGKQTCRCQPDSNHNRIRDNSILISDLR